MAPISLWTGNLRLSLVLVPVKLFSAVSTEGQIAFRMIHEPSGKPIRYVKGVETESGFERFPTKRSSRATSTPRAITSSSDPRRLMS
jgi:non-homologous end joining protein Ku